MSENSVIQMYSAADTDAAAVIDVPDDGVLLSSTLMGKISGFAADGDGVIAQLSFASVSQFTTNDARGVLANLICSADLTGVAANTIRSDISLLFSYGDGIKVFGGERIYLHIVDSGAGVNLGMYALLLFNFKTFIQRRR